MELNCQQVEVYTAQLLITNTFCHNILSISTAIYSQSAEFRDKIFIKFYQRVKISRKYRRNHQDHTESL